MLNQDNRLLEFNILCEPGRVVVMVNQSGRRSKTIHTSLVEALKHIDRISPWYDPRHSEPLFEMEEC